MRANDQCPAVSFRPVTAGVLADRMPQDKRAGTYSVLKPREALLPFFTLPRHCTTYVELGVMEQLVLIVSSTLFGICSPRDIRGRCTC